MSTKAARNIHDSVGQVAPNMTYADIVSMADVASPKKDGRLVVRTKLSGWIGYGYPSGIEVILQVLEVDGSAVAVKFSQNHPHVGWSSHYRSYISFDKHQFSRAADQCHPTRFASVNDIADINLNGVTVSKTAGGIDFVRSEFLEGDGPVSERQLLVDVSLALPVTVPCASQRTAADDLAVAEAIHPSILAHGSLKTAHAGRYWLVAGLVERDGRCYGVQTLRQFRHDGETPEVEMREWGPASLMEAGRSFYTTGSVSDCQIVADLEIALGITAEEAKGILREQFTGPARDLFEAYEHTLRTREPKWCQFARRRVLEAIQRDPAILRLFPAGREQDFKIYLEDEEF